MQVDLDLCSWVFIDVDYLEKQTAAGIFFYLFEHQKLNSIHLYCTVVEAETSEMEISKPFQIHTMCTGS